MKTNIIIQGDCLEEMKRLQDNSVDVIITDPPYGKKWCRNNSKTGGFGTSPDLTENIKNIQWDKERPTKKYFDEMLRIGKIVIIFGGNYFSDYLPPSNCWVVWDKKRDKKFKNPFADCELIWTNQNKVIKKINLIQQGFVNESKDKRYHPTQKPTEVVEKLLEMFTKKGDLVLDPFIGSGTTAIACLKLNRKFIGIEKEPEYVKIANVRIKSYLEQTKLNRKYELK